MISRRWNRSRILAIWFWGILAALLTADLGAGLYRMESRETNAQKTADVQKTADAQKTADTQKTAYAGTVALTFDDGPHAIYTPRLLDGLKERGIHASFFLIGQNIDGKEDIVLRMQKEGHLIGNHSQNHIQLTAEDAQEALKQIEYTNRKIEEITGTAPAYIRPPYGRGAGGKNPDDGGAVESGSPGLEKPE